MVLVKKFWPPSLYEQTTTFQQGEKTSQIWGITLGLPQPYCNIICLTNPTWTETNSSKQRNLH